RRRRVRPDRLCGAPRRRNARAIEPTGSARAPARGGVDRRHAAHRQSGASSAGLNITDPALTIYLHDRVDVLPCRKDMEGHVGHSLKSAAFLIESRLAGAAHGNVKALYELGVAYSTGSDGVDVDLIEAHKWFNLAALNGNHHAQQSR